MAFAPWGKLFGPMPYPSSEGYVIRVVGDQVYNQAGEAIDIANKDPYAFWVSERYNPLTNKPDDDLLR